MLNVLYSALQLLILKRKSQKKQQFTIDYDQFLAKLETKALPEASTSIDVQHKRP